MTSEGDTGSLCSQLEEVIKCAICWELPTSPKVLPCQHSFCLRCLYPSYLADLEERHHSRDRIQCPLCRQVCSLPKNGLTSLPSDHRTKAVTELVQRRRYNQRKKTCSVCKVTNVYQRADYFCLTCGVLLCTNCNENHGENKLYQNHIQVELFNPDSSKLYCVDHPKEIIQYFCGDCERPICNACTHTKHATHRSTNFIKSSDADTTLVRNFRQFMADKEDEITEHRNEIKVVQEMSKRDKEMIIQELSEIRDEISRLREREAELDRRLRMHDRVERRLEEMDATMITSLERLQQMDDVIKAATTPLRQYKQYTVSDVSLQSLQKAFTNIPLPVRDLSLMRTQYRKMVASYETDIDDDVTGMHSFMEIDADAINADVRALWRQDMTFYDVQFLRDGSRRLVCTAQLRDWKLFVLDFDGDPDELPASLSRFSDCQCRLMVNGTTSTICLTHKKKSDGWNLPFSVIYPDGSTVAGSIRTSYEQNSLCGIVVTRYNDVIFPFMGYGFPPQSTSLRCHSPDGAYRWYRDTSVGTGSGHLISPHYVTVDPLDRVIVSDHYGCKISIYDNMGRHLLSFPNITLPEDAEESDVVKLNLPRPAGICVNSKAYIYVAFPTHDVISLFTPNGQFIRHVVSTRGKARGISICDDRYLAVTTFDAGIWLYDLEPADHVTGNSDKFGEDDVVNTGSHQSDGIHPDGSHDRTADLQPAALTADDNTITDDIADVGHYTDVDNGIDIEHNDDAEKGIFIEDTAVIDSSSKKDHSTVVDDSTAISHNTSVDENTNIDYSTSMVHSTDVDNTIVDESTPKSQNTSVDENTNIDHNASVVHGTDVGSTVVEDSTAICQNTSVDENTNIDHNASVVHGTDVGSTVVDNSTAICQNTSVDENTNIDHNASVVHGTVVGSTVVDDNTAIGHNTSVDENTNIDHNASVVHGTDVGSTFVDDNTAIGHNTSVDENTNIDHSASMFHSTDVGSTAVDEQTDVNKTIFMDQNTAVEISTNTEYSASVDDKADTENSTLSKDCLLSECLTSAEQTTLAEESTLIEQNTLNNESIWSKESTVNDHSILYEENRFNGESTANGGRTHTGERKHTGERTHNDERSHNVESTPNRDRTHVGERVHNCERTPNGERRHSGETTHSGERAYNCERTPNGGRTHNGERTHNGGLTHNYERTHNGEMTHSGDASFTHDHSHQSGSTLTGDSTPAHDSAVAGDSNLSCYRTPNGDSTLIRDSATNGCRAHTNDDTFTCDSNLICDSSERDDSTRNGDSTHTDNSALIVDSIHNGYNAHNCYRRHNGESTHNCDSTYEGDNPQAGDTIHNGDSAQDCDIAHNSDSVNNGDSELNGTMQLMVNEQTYICEPLNATAVTIEGTGAEETIITL